MSGARIAGLILAATFVVGCGSPKPGPADAGGPESGPTDAGTPDASEPDAGATDAGPVDAGEPDAGTRDAGPADAGATDAGLADAGATDAGPPDAGATVGRVVSFTPPPEPDPATLPAAATDGGALILAGSPNALLVWSPPAPGPMTAFARCTKWVTGCLSAERSLDDCARSVPTCATDQPWSEPACCPAACFQRYATARLQGTADVDAFLGVYLDPGAPCIPGLGALLGSRP